MQSRLRFEPSLVTLGSVQLGMAYGIANTSGQPTQAEAFGILDRAVELGINTIDTARAYGTAEEIISHWLASRRLAGVRVVTKVPKVPPGPDAERKRFVHEQIIASKAALGIERLALVLTHGESDLLDPAVVDEFRLALATSSIEAFGASVYDPDVAARLIATAPIAALQVPASIADRRFEQAGVFRAASARGIAIFVRSVFLQGVLLMAPERVPEHLKAFTPFLAALADAARRSGRSIPELLITAIRDVPGVTSLVLGIDTPTQLETNAAALRAPPLPTAMREDLIRSASSIPPDILIPTNWKRVAGWG